MTPEETTEDTDFDGNEDSDSDDDAPCVPLSDLLRSKTESLGNDA